MERVAPHVGHGIPVICLNQHLGHGKPKASQKKQPAATVTETASNSNSMSVSRGARGRNAISAFFLVSTACIDPFTVKSQRRYTGHELGALVV
jgi:hypothetical protein